MTRQQMGAAGRQRGAALVTGAARRIGRAIALALADDGYAVALHCNRSKDDAEALAGEIAARGSRAAVLDADLADAAAVEALVPRAAGAIGGLSLLVNSASVFEADEIGHMRIDAFERTMAINLRAPLFLSQAFARQVPRDAHDPSIVQIIDQRVLRPRPDYFSYYLSKSGLYTATQTLAQALAPRIRVNGIGPGPSVQNVFQSEADFAREAGNTPLGHGSDPADIADAVLYLAHARSVTGQMLAVDGGQHLAWSGG